LPSGDARILDAENFREVAEARQTREAKAALAR
jgi:hypothetical protein